MKTKGISFALIFLVGSLVSPIGFSKAEVSTVPFAPTNLVVNSVSNSKIDLSWNAPVNATISEINGYKIEIDTGCFGTFSTLVANTTTTSTTYSSDGLTSGLCYQYRVSALNSVGSSTSSNVAVTTTWSVPNAPTNLNANAVSSSQINLSWSTPSNSGGTPINGYKIEKMNSCSGNFAVLVANTTNPNTTYSNTGLTNGTCYQYRVFAINAVGSSLSSNNVTATTLQPPVSNNVPDAPTGLLATAVSSSQINLVWAGPSNNGGSSITGYNIEEKIGSGSYSVIVSNTGNTNTLYSRTGLTAGTTYTYRVSAINLVGTSTVSNESSATPTISPSVTVPSAPTGLSVSVLSKNALKLTWNAPPNSGGAPILGYKIQRNGTTIVNNTSYVQTNYINNGLLAGHQQTYRVAAWNSQGLGPFSSNATGKTNNQNTTNIDNLGQQIANFVQQHNELLKQQRNETIKLIQECNQKFVNTPLENRTKVKEECKNRMDAIKEKYKAAKKQFHIDFKVFRETVKSQIKDVQKQKILDKRDEKDFKKHLQGFLKDTKMEEKQFKKAIMQIVKDTKMEEKQFKKAIKEIKKENKKAKSKDKHHEEDD